MGPAGKTCGGAQLSGEQLAGEPFVNAHYARQLQGWMLQRALSGQLWNAADRRLRLAPRVSASDSARVPWFTTEAAGLVHVLPADASQGEHHRIEVVAGALKNVRVVLQVHGAEYVADVTSSTLQTGEKLELV